MKKKNNSLLKSEFSRFCNNNNVIEEDGFEKMASVLNIDMYSDIFLTYFCFKCNCKNFGKITFEEFSNGLKEFNTQNFDDLKNKVITIKENLLNISDMEFKEFYKFLFTFNLDSTDKKKQLDFEIVELYFNNLFSGQFKIVNDFLYFLKNHKKCEGLTYDQWTCFLDFLLTIGDNFPKGYKLSDSWPTLFDEFSKEYCLKNGLSLDQEDENEEGLFN